MARLLSIEPIDKFPTFNFFKKKWKLFQSIDSFTRIVVVSFMLIIISTPFIVNNTQIFNPKAEEKDEVSQPVVQNQSSEPEFLSNEVLIKIKRSEKDKVKEGSPEDTGIPSLNTINKEHKVKKFEKIAKEGKNSLKDADIFQWYIIELDKEAKTLKAKYNKGQGGLQAEDPETLAYFRTLEQFKQDSSIEVAEPNFIVTAFQSPTPSGCADGTTEQNFGTTSGGNKVHGCNGLAPYASAGILCASGWHVGDLKLDSGLATLLSGIPGNTVVRSVYMNGDPGNMTGIDPTARVANCWGSPLGSGCDPATSTSRPVHLNDPSFATTKTYLNGILVTSGYVAGGGGGSGAICIENTVVPTPTINPSIPNDPYYSSKGSWGQVYDDSWGLKKINLQSAWNQTTGSTSIVIADIDTGVDRSHEDLAANMWVNTAETPNNGVDDDNNGYKDDYYGWDFANNDNDPMDDHGHGTHTVGTIAGVGNNGIGVVGVNWTSKIMALKFIGSSGSGSTENAIKALQYAADMGASVSSNSWGCGCQSIATDNAVKYEHDKGMIMVAAAGNNNGDALDFSPASADYAITVAASDSNDAKASFSNWGQKIDVTAPGVDILSLRAPGTDMYKDGNHFVPNGDPNAKYYRANGTSMATPHVAGLAALLFAKNPTLTNEEVRQIIRKGATDLGTAGKDKDFGYGRIDANNTLSQSNTKPLTPVITSPASRTALTTTSVQVLGSVAGTDFASYKVEFGLGRTPANWTLATNSTTQVINGVLATINTSTVNDGLYTIRVTAIDTNNKSYQFQVYDVEVDNFDAGISSPEFAVLSGSVVNVVGTAHTKNSAAFTNYKLEWGVGRSPASWSATGITLTNAGVLPVSNGNLGTWDTSSLSLNQTYSLRLTVNSNFASQTATNVVTASSCVYNFAWKSEDGDFNFPWGIATDSSGNVYAADTNTFWFPAIAGDTIAEAALASDGTDHNFIRKYTSDGTFITRWASGAEWAHGVAVDSSNNVYVTDHHSSFSNITKSTSEGIFITRWGNFGSGPGQFNGPYGIATDSFKNVYVADLGNKRIQKFTQDGVFIKEWGTIEKPTGVAVDSSNNVYVVSPSSNNTLLEKFTSEGVLITQWPRFGGVNPYDVAVDLGGDVYIAMYPGIKKFTSAGVFITQWGTFGPDAFFVPLNIAVDASNNVYVANPEFGRIEKFTPQCVAPTPTPLPTATPTPKPTSTPIPTPTPTPIPPDTTKPTITITSPINGSRVSRNSTVTISATSSDNVGVTRVEFLVNGTLVCTDSIAPYTCAWRVPPSPNKAYTLLGKAFDAAFNTNTHTVSVTSSK